MTTTHSHSTEQTQPFERRGGSRRPSALRKVGGPVLVAAALWGGVQVAKAGFDSAHEAMYGPERDMVAGWLKEGKGPEVAPVIVTVSSKAVTRETPAIRNSSADAGLDNRADLLTEENTTLVINYPFRKTDDEGNSFVGFMDPSNPIDHKEVADMSNEDRAKEIADRITWVSVEAKDDNGAPLVRFYDMPNVESPNTIQALVATDGSITLTGAASQAAGEARIMAAADAHFITQSLSPAQG